jgi:hypothetical protein
LVWSLIICKLWSLTKNCNGTLTSITFSSFCKLDSLVIDVRLKTEWETWNLFKKKEAKKHTASFRLFCHKTLSLWAVHSRPPYRLFAARSLSSSFATNQIDSNSTRMANEIRKKAVYSSQSQTPLFFNLCFEFFLFTLSFSSNKKKHI